MMTRAVQPAFVTSLSLKILLLPSILVIPISPCLAVQPLQSSVDDANTKEPINQIVKLNNEGVNALNKNDYSLATAKFLAALKSDPSYRLALDNLAITYNNQGLILRERNPALALRKFHQALFFNPNDATILQNVEGMIRSMGKNPTNFDARMELGDKELSAKDYVGATMEYAAALRIKYDQKVVLKLEDTTENLTLTDKSILKANTIKTAKTNAAVDNPEIDFGPFMADLQRRIKRAWFPPKHNNDPSRVTIAFKIHRGGDLSDQRVLMSSNVDLIDAAALRAVESASPFRPLPQGSRESIDIAFTFEYNDPAATNETPPQPRKFTPFDVLPVEIQTKYVDPYKLSPTQLMEWLEAEERKLP